MIRYLLGAGTVLVFVPFAAVIDAVRLPFDYAAVAYYMRKGEPSWSQSQ